MLHHLRLDLCWNCHLAPRISILETENEYILCKSLPAAYVPRPRQMPELLSAFVGTSFTGEIYCSSMMLQCLVMVECSASAIPAVK